MFAKRRSRFGYVVRETRVASPAAAGFPLAGGRGKRLGQAVKKLAYIGALLALFVVAAGQITRYAVTAFKSGYRLKPKPAAAAPAVAVPEKEEAAAPAEKEGGAKPGTGFSFFASQKYLISAGDYYRVMTSGKIEMVAESLGNAEYPFLTGIYIDESRPEHLKALKQALAINDNCLKDVSEVCIRDPRNMYMVKKEGEKIIFGDSITREKLDNYITARDKLDELDRRFSVMDLRYKDRAIIK